MDITPEMMVALAYENAERERNKGPLMKAFDKADTRFRMAVQRVACASTDQPGALGMSGGALSWREFNEALTELQNAACERHSAKHCAFIEAMHAPPAPIRVVVGAPQDKGGAQDG